MLGAHTQTPPKREKLEKTMITNNESNNMNNPKETSAPTLNCPTRHPTTQKQRPDQTAKAHNCPYNF